MNKAPLLTLRLEQAMSMAIRVHGSMKRKGDGFSAWRIGAHRGGNKGTGMS